MLEGKKRRDRWTFTACPEGHRLPNNTERGQCTPVYCAFPPGTKAVETRSKNAPEALEDVAEPPASVPLNKDGTADKRYGARPNAKERKTYPNGPRVRKGSKTALDRVASVASRLGLEEGEEIDPTEAEAFNRAESRYRIRQAITKTPTGLQGADATAYAETKLASLVPDAVGVVEEALKFGDMKERYTAATRILGYHGFTERDMLASGGQPVIVLKIDGGSLPWSQKSGTVTAQVVKPKLPEGEE